MKLAKARATYADLLALPEHVRAEIVGGELVVAPAPLPRHGRIHGALGRFIGGPYDYDGDGPGGWWILPEVDVQFSEHDVMRPDWSGWQRERLAEPWGLRPIPLVPDWICEIVSPSNAAHDRVTKRHLYAKHGVRFYWIFDPEARTLEALRLHGAAWLEVGSFDEHAVARIAPFEDVEISLEKIFPPR